MIVVAFLVCLVLFVVLLFAVCCCVMLCLCPCLVFVFVSCLFRVFLCFFSGVSFSLSLIQSECFFVTEFTSINLLAWFSEKEKSSALYR